MICSEADAKSDALKILSTADLSACGLGAADTVYRAVQALALDENVNQNGFAYEYVKTDSNNCNGNIVAGQNLAKQVQTESIENCLALGHSSCVSLQPKFIYTADGYCVASCESDKASNSTMPEVGKLLVAKSLLAAALNLYHVIPCDSGKASSLIHQAEGLIKSANIEADPYGMCPFNR